MRKLYISTKFPHHEIRWNYVIFRSEKQSVLGVLQETLNWKFLKNFPKNISLLHSLVDVFLVIFRYKSYSFDHLKIIPKWIYQLTPFWCFFVSVFLVPGIFMLIMETCDIQHFLNFHYFLAKNLFFDIYKILWKQWFMKSLSQIIEFQPPACNYSKTVSIKDIFPIFL